MIKLVVFDLDGVLVEAREIHYVALNRAITNVAGPDFIITRDEHAARYDGLPTRQKLSMLTQYKRLQPNLHDAIWKQKQCMTGQVIKEVVKQKDHTKIIDLLSWLQSLRLKVYCASNSIHHSTKMMLLCAGYMEFIDKFFSNESVDSPKPHPEIYLRCMIDAGVGPRETLIVEDSHIGRKAAADSGAHIMGVSGLPDVNRDNMEKAIQRANTKNESTFCKPKWQGGNMNVLIPMAGAGIRFEQAGYTFPKPLVEVNGKPMIQVVVENLNIDARHIFIVKKAHREKYNLDYLLKAICDDCELVEVDGITEGAACTTLLAKEFFDNNDPLLIANSDQFVEWNSNEFLYAMQSRGVDGGILTFTAVHPKWSFAKVDDDGFVVEVAEKKPISDIATVGIYYWNHGMEYVTYAERMIQANDRVNGEFYVCPVFNYAIKDGAKIRTHHVDKMWGLGTPEDLDRFLKDHE